MLFYQRSLASIVMGAAVSAAWLYSHGTDDPILHVPEKINTISIISHEVMENVINDVETPVERFTELVAMKNPEPRVQTADAPMPQPDGPGGQPEAQAVQTSSVNWDAVAACESSGNWSINTGNGFSGGLQFVPSTWSGYGGGEFAPLAHQATREQQIIVAERVLRGQGIGAWPVCGKRG